MHAIRVQVTLRQCFTRAIPDNKEKLVAKLDCWNAIGACSAEGKASLFLYLFGYSGGVAAAICNFRRLTRL
jgi:hypothetical protein